jgi:hypothetical protein
MPARRLVLTLLLSLALSCTTAFAGLVAHWPFEEGSGTTTENVVRASDDDLINGPTWTTTALAPIPDGTTAALNFVRNTSANQYVVATDGYQGVTGTDARSISAWVQTTGPGDQEIISWGLDNPAPQGQKWVFRLQDDSGPFDGVLRVEVNGGYQVGSTDLRDGRWHHVVATWEDDGSPNVQDVKLYVDGKAEGISISQSQSMNTAAGEVVRIGAEVWNTGRPFNGGMDDVRIYDHALPLGEIRILATGYDAAPPDMRHDANRSSDASVWNDIVGLNYTTPGSLDLNLSGVVHDPDPSTDFGRIQGTYVFDGSAAGVFGTTNFQNAYQGDPTNGSVTFETLFRPDDLLGQEVIWEFGGATDGSSLTLNGDLLQFTAKDGGQNGSTSLDLDANNDGVIDYDDFLHVVTAVDLSADRVYLYLNGASMTPGGIAATGDIADWAGSDSSSLGSRTGGDTGGSSGAFGNLTAYGGFDGDLARFSLYERVLTPDEVRELYSNTVIPEPGTLALVALGVGLLRRRRR